MSHDETSGPVTRSAGDTRSSERKERRAAPGGKRQAAPRYVFSAAAHVRQDWTPEDLIEMLENKARGYNGILRELLCTTAETLRQQEIELNEYRAAYAVEEDEMNEAVKSMQEMVDASALMPVGVEDDGS